MQRGSSNIKRGRGRGKRDAFYASSLPSAPPASSLPLPNIEWRTKSTSELPTLTTTPPPLPPTSPSPTIPEVEIQQKALKQAERRGGSLLQLPTNALPLWICHKQHRFSQSYEAIVGGVWCGSCEESISERAIRMHLEMLGLDYKCEVTFPSLVNVGGGRAPLRFDYYIPALRWLIEADGEQHFGSSKFKGTLLKRLQNDQRKDEWSITSAMTMQRIPFWELDRIEVLVDEVHARLKRGEGPLYICGYREWRENAIRLVSQKKKAPPAPIPPDARERTRAARDSRREDVAFSTMVASERLLPPAGLL